MPLSIRIISSPDGEPIAIWNQTFPEEGGEIGRSFGAAMQLNDSKHEVSGTHAIIRKTSSGYQIEDNSTNGLFLNGAFSALGKGGMALLNDGDVLDVGRYRLLISCFIPEQARAQIVEKNERRADFNDDPFQIEMRKAVDPSDFQQKIRDNEMYVSIAKNEGDLVLDDPFLMDEIEQKQIQTEFMMEFQRGDQEEPFSDAEYNASFSTMVANAGNFEEEKSYQYLMTEFKKSSFSIEDQIEKAVDKALDKSLDKSLDMALNMALTRFLADISPAAIEEMFNELSLPKRWFRKPKYWEMYTRYFARQTDSCEWKLKFNSYVHDAIRLQRNFDGGEK